MKVIERLIKGDMHGIHYAVSIFVATTVLWASLRYFSESNPIWAISSMVATSDPQMQQAISTFKARIANAFVGCIIGLLFIAIGGTRVLMLPLAMAATVLASSYIVRIPTMWRQAPITAAFVIAAGLQHQSRINGLVAGGQRMAEVLLGSVVGLVVAWIVSVIWPLPEPAVVAQTAK